MTKSVIVSTALHLKAAISAATTDTTIVLKPGNYGKVEFLASRDGNLSSNASITLVSEQPQKAIITGMKANGFKNLTLHGIMFDSVTEITPQVILSAALGKKEKCYGASDVLCELMERNSRKRRERLERDYRLSPHWVFGFSVELSSLDRRIEALQEDQGRYCLPNELGDFSVNQFIERWMKLNKESLYGELVPFRQLRAVCVTYMRIITMIERMDDKGEHTQQALLSVVAFVLATEIATSENDQSDEATAIGRETGLSCQEYRQKVTGRSIFDGLVSRSALKGEARFPKRTKLNLSEGLRENEDLNWRPVKKVDFAGTTRSICDKSRRTGRSPTPFRASDGGHMYRRLRAYRAIGKQEYQRAALAYQSKLQAESLCASCA